VWAVVRSSFDANVFLDTYSAVIATFVFAFSIISFGFKFGETAASFRECYLRLQKLYESSEGEAKLSAEYHEILGGYGNHAERDYESFVLSRTLFDNKSIWDRRGNAIDWNPWMLAKWILRTGLYWALTSAFIVLGAVPYVIVFKPL
jgi:hypothetical protein